MLAVVPDRPQLTCGCLKVGYPSLAYSRFDYLVGSLDLVGFQNLATCAEQQFHAARSYSLIKPPRTGRHLICL
jgi:hypothetical protein